MQMNKSKVGVETRGTPKTLTRSWTVDGGCAGRAHSPVQQEIVDDGLTVLAPDARQMPPSPGALHLGLGPGQLRLLDGRHAELLQADPAEPARTHDFVDGRRAIRHPQPQGTTVRTTHVYPQHHLIFSGYDFDLALGVPRLGAMGPCVVPVVELRQ
jgi:hypothetical protein